MEVQDFVGNTMAPRIPKKKKTKAIILKWKEINGLAQRIGKREVLRAEGAEAEEKKKQQLREERRTPTRVSHGGTSQRARELS